MTNVTEIMKRRASKLRSFVPKPVDRKVEGSEENETEDKLPELVSSSNRLWKSQKIIIFFRKNQKKLGYAVLCTQSEAMFEIGCTMGSLKKDWAEQIIWKNVAKRVQTINTLSSCAPVGTMAGRCQREHSTRPKMDELELLEIHSINDMEFFMIQLMSNFL